MELRLILLVLGGLVIVGVYLYSRRSSPSHTLSEVEREFASKREPTLDGYSSDPDEDLPSMRAIDVEEDEESPPVDGAESVATPESEREEKIIVLNILPLEAGGRFHGGDLLDVFDRAGLEYGQFEVFHRIRDTDAGPRSVFSVASATEPGSFDITTMADESFRGLSLFMLLPGPVRGVDAFADMLATARRIAEQIKGDVLDRNRSSLTRQTAHHIREDILGFEHRQQSKSGG